MAACSAERQSVVQLASLAGQILSENMPAGVQFLLLAYTDGKTCRPAQEDYLLCFRSEQDRFEAAEVLRQMAASIEDGLEEQFAPAAGQA